jgi:hypothetical protein
MQILPVPGTETRHLGGVAKSASERVAAALQFRLGSGNRNNKMSVEATAPRPCIAYRYRGVARGHVLYTAPVPGSELRLWLL